MELSCVMYGNVESEVDGGLDDENEGTCYIAGGSVSRLSYDSCVRVCRRRRGLGGDNGLRRSSAYRRCTVNVCTGGYCCARRTRTAATCCTSCSCTDGCTDGGERDGGGKESSRRV